MGDLKTVECDSVCSLGLEWAPGTPGQDCGIYSIQTPSRLLFYGLFIDLKKKTNL